ncbi:MAG: FAD-dependent oxidoreductase [Burkholderiaceae bacterium]|nr:FAD-dependent oxidoreductase [Burkholderiaceae bacterium]
MVTQPSRRAFLIGRRTPATPWGQFCARLSRVCVGRVQWDQEAQTSQAWLYPARDIDVQHAQALCGQLGVQLILMDSEACPDPERPILWVDSHAEWAHSELEDPSARLWRVEAGVTLGTLYQKGVGMFAEDPALRESSLTIAQWFARPIAGDLSQSGIVQAEVLLADGTLERLGPFGAKGSAPLKSLSMQRNIPRLFELAQSRDAALCAQRQEWPSRYRLDALMSHAGDSPNLAWLFAGHGGSLAWLQTIWIQKSEHTLPIQHVSGEHASLDQGTEDEVRHVSILLDQSIKQILDPAGVFGKTPPAKGLESPQLN